MTRRQKFLEAKQGKRPCDLIVKRVKFLDVYSCQWREGDVSVVDGCFLAFESGLKGTIEIDGRGKFLVPGFIDAHVHVESSMLLPGNFARVALPKGTTTAICDPHEAANVLGLRGIEFFLEEAPQLPIDMKVMLSSCVPATHLETNGGGVLSASDLSKLKNRSHALGLAEMMNVPGVLFGDPLVHEKLEAFSDRIIDGHCPRLSGLDLSAYIACGISSCHEVTELAEAQEKLSKGMAVWIREGSVAKDLDRLIPVLNGETSACVGFCTDDRNPRDIADEGHLDFLIRKAIAHGMRPEWVYRAASWSVARHYALSDRGAIAPGKLADFVLLDDMQTCAVRSVYRQGVLAESLLAEMPSRRPATPNTVKADIPLPSQLEGPKGQVRVIGIESGKILTRSLTEQSTAKGIARLSVLERHGHHGVPANGYVRGFGDRFSGAIASSVGHDSHNLIVAGSSTEDMVVSLKCLKEMGGGFCVSQGGKVLAKLPLAFAGLMSNEAPDAVVQGLSKLAEASRAVGCDLAEPFLQLAFLSLPVIPDLKLTDKGLVDVKRFELIPVAV